jgi:hypothetical protein
MNTKNQKIINISIVGAGPGDPELLTIKALKRIQDADIILHDNLISEEILNLASAKAQKIYVGRKFGDIEDSMTRQDAIHELFLEYAQQDKKIVRLKSGDSFIFGRVAEEIRFLTQQTLLLKLFRELRQEWRLPTPNISRSRNATKPIQCYFVPDIPLRTTLSNWRLWRICLKQVPRSLCIWDIKI